MDNNKRSVGRPKKEETCTINFRVLKSKATSIKDHLRPIVKKLNNN